MPPMEHFGTHLKRFRDARGWSQEQLGFELEVSKATISKWEAGQAQPRWEHLAHLRRLVAEDGLTLDYLIDGAAPGTAGATPSRESTPRTAGNADEEALLARFRALKPSRRKGLLALLAGVKSGTDLGFNQPPVRSAFLPLPSGNQRAMLDASRIESATMQATPETVERPPDRPIDRWFASYSSHHRNPTNQWIHVFAVPAILWSVIAVLWCIPSKHRTCTGADTPATAAARPVAAAPA